MADYAIQAKAQDINFVGKFTSDLHNLLNVLGQSDVQVVAPGTAFKLYKSSGSLATDAVAEKGLIPDSGIAMEEVSVEEITYGKYRNLTSIEKIGKLGYEVAVGGTNTSLLKDVQKGIRKSIFAGLAKGTGTATGTAFQHAVAMGASAVEKAFEDEAATIVAFASPDDVYGYLGTHNITLENEFGLSYLKNFMGLGNVVVDSNVPAGTVYVTATENLAVIAPSIASIPGLEMTTDESGIIAVHNGAAYQNASLETVAYCGLAVQPVIADRIIKATFSA